MTNKGALKAVARLMHINLHEASTVVRSNVLIDEEIHIEEELVNLEETIATYIMAADSLDRYPRMKFHFLREKRIIIKHCLGLINRMIHNKRLPRNYNQADTDSAVKQLVRLVVLDTQKAGIRMDARTKETVKPFLSWRQRLALLSRTSKPMKQSRKPLARIQSKSRLAVTRA